MFSPQHFTPPLGTSAQVWRPPEARLLALAGMPSTGVGVPTNISGFPPWLPTCPLPTCPQPFQPQHTVAPSFTAQACPSPALIDVTPDERPFTGVGEK